MTATLESAPGPALPFRGARALIVSGSVGAGHDGAAAELAARLRAAGLTVQVRDFLAAVPGPAARLLRDGYTASVGHVPLAFEFLFSRLERRGLLWQAEQLVCRSGERTVSRWVAEDRPDLVVATYPLAAQCLGTLRADGRLRVPLLTYLTDPAAHRSWLHPAADGHLTVTAATAVQGTADYGVPMTVAGPLVPARFGEVVPPWRLSALRRELGVPVGRPVALLVAGSLGLGDVDRTARDVVAAGLLPLVLCGRNSGLQQRLAGIPGVRAVGWRRDVHELMQMADVLVQNAGGLSFTEALVAGLPAVTYRPIPGHGRANAGVLDRAGLAPWARSRTELAAALHRQLGVTRGVRRWPDPARTVLGVLADPARPAA
jgi:UDP-N-acetylglucosamine:LPS N-acetylglucosamine transferase